MVVVPVTETDGDNDCEAVCVTEIVGLMLIVDVGVYEGEDESVPVFEGVQEGDDEGVSDRVRENVIVGVDDGDKVGV